MRITTSMLGDLCQCCDGGFMVANACLLSEKANWQHLLKNKLVIAESGERFNKVKITVKGKQIIDGAFEGIKSLYVNPN